MKRPYNSTTVIYVQAVIRVQAFKKSKGEKVVVKMVQGC